MILIIMNRMIIMNDNDDNTTRCCARSRPTLPEVPSCLRILLASQARIGATQRDPSNTFNLDVLNVTKYKKRACSLQFRFIKIIESDFWGWGLSVWPLENLAMGRAKI